METQDLTPKKLGIYVIERPLGKGGMGAVYLAADPTLKRKVAIKVLPPELAADHECVARFEREATSLAKIRHPNLVHIYAVGCDAHLHYIVMEYIKGLSVAEILRQRGALPHTTAVRILGQVLSALDKVHAARIVHRDLKPANIMIDEDERAILMDFGLAKPRHDRSVTVGHTIIGTPEYMAPELAEGHDADFRSDIYALGIILFEMLTGRVPFQGNSAIATLRQHIEHRPPSPSKLTPNLPPELEAIIARALAKKPGDRYLSVRGLAADLLAVVQTPELTALAAPAEAEETPPTIPMAGDTTATVAGPGDLPASEPRRWLSVVAGACAATLLILIGAFVVPRLLRGPDTSVKPPAAIPSTASGKPPAVAGDAASKLIFVVYARGGAPTSGRLLAIEGEEGDVVLKTGNGTVRIPYRQVLRIEPVAER
jgi:serine/threonine-protein kinase